MRSNRETEEWTHYRKFEYSNVIEEVDKRYRHGTGMVQTSDSKEALNCNDMEKGKEEG